MALYKRGDLVWAKMKGFPPWPGIITAPPAELKKQPSKKSTLYHCIFLFGTEKYSWIETHKLDRYNKGSGNTGRKRSAALREAVVAIEAYIDNGEAAPNFNITPEGDVFDKLVSESKSTHSRHQQHLSPPKSKSKKTGDDSDMHTISSGIESVKELTSIRQEMALKVDNIINLTESSSLSGDTSKHSVSPPDFKSPNQNKSSTSATNLSTKKKQVQQIFRARPFRQLAKPRALERKSGSNEWDIRSSTTPSPMDSSSKKRSSATTRSQESSPSEAKKKKLQLHSDTDATTPMFHPHAHSYARRGPADRPPNIARPETPPLDLLSVSQIFLNKHITPSPLLFGFLGLGIMGSRMVKNLMNSGHRVIVWNHSPEKSREFAKVGAEIGATPQDVCSAADITFSCVSGPKAAKDMVFGNCGALREMNSTKAYVEMTNIDKETSLDIAAAITSRGARYLEAQIQGSKAEADKATLVILAAGDLSLYNDCQSCFEAFGRSSFFLGEVGTASKMNLVIQMIAGITVTGLAEGLALADRCGLKQADILEVISMTSLGCPMILDKGKCITECSFPTSLALSYMQKDLKLGLKLGDELKQPLPMTTIANEVYKHSKRLGYGDHDASAVYMGASLNGFN